MRRDNTLILRYPNLFQSTHPRGVRLDNGEHMDARSGYFNPRTRVGCDAKLVSAKEQLRPFQSTHPRGVRLMPASRPLDGDHFNPRTRVGCDFRQFDTP